MGQVTFNGDIATAESMVFIRGEETKILLGTWDDFTKTRKIEQLYQQHGLHPFTPYRAGAVPDDSRSGKSIPADNWPLLKRGVGWVGGFILCLVALELMRLWGH